MEYRFTAAISGWCFRITRCSRIGHAFLGGRTEFTLVLQNGSKCVIELANDGQNAMPTLSAVLRVWVAASDCLTFPLASAQ